ncbi:MAG: endonuclease/exonuclease/phosphatase [Cyanobacteria bacterium P01_A01_bin.135]
MAELTEAEWDRINALFAQDPYRYGLPQREYGSAVLASFNIRKLGKVSSRSANTWNFLAKVCSHFDLLAVQEIMEDLEGFDRLLETMGEDFNAVVSDVTGVFPGERGLGERLGFIYNTNLVKRGPIVSDISFDRTKLLATLVQHHRELIDALAPYLEYLEKHERWQLAPAGPAPRKPRVQVPVFLTFIRQPFTTSFSIVGHPGTQPYQLMAINAHLYFGESIQDRRQEFDALMQWTIERVRGSELDEYPNQIILGDLNLDFDNPKRDRPRIETHIKTFNQDMEKLGNGINVNFPFLDVHPNYQEPFRTNARLNQTFDQIGLFSHDARLPTYRNNATVGTYTRGPDYGVFNFVELFREALGVPPIDTLDRGQKQAFFSKFDHEVSDHMPLWVRLPLPNAV